MSIYFILFLCILLTGLAILAWLLLRKWRQLRMLDPSSLPREQSRRVKVDIMRQRVERSATKRVQAVTDGVFRPAGGFMQRMVRKAAGKLQAVEQAYQSKQQTSQDLSPAVLAKMLKEAKRLMEREEWDRAEKALIEIITCDPKYADAYELLGRFYYLRKDDEQARETLEFAKKLDKKNASMLALLGEVEMRRGKPNRAFDHFGAAVELRPKNPRYLDLYIDCAIQTEHLHEATSALDQLRESNPDNKKIDVFENAIDAARSKKRGDNASEGADHPAETHKDNDDEVSSELSETESSTDMRDTENKDGETK